MLAHELRNPLAAIRNAVAASPAGRRDEHLELGRARSSSGRSSTSPASIDDLLDVSRITRGKIELRRGARRRSAPVLDAGRRDGPAARRGAAAPARLDARPPGPLAVEADPTRLEQVVVNLLTNAAKYTEPGGRIAVDGRATGGAGRHPRPRTTGSASPPEKLPADVRAVRPGRPLARPLRGGPRHRPDARAQPRRDARRERLGARARARGGAASSRCGSPRPRPRRRAPPSDQSRPRRGAAARGLARSSWSTTTWTPPEAWPRLAAAPRATTSGSPTTARRRSSRPRTSGPRSCSSTSACPGMDGYEVARGCARRVLPGGGHHRRHRLRPGRGPRRSREAGFDHHLVKPVDFDSLISLIVHPPAAAPEPRPLIPKGETR